MSVYISHYINYVFFATFRLLRQGARETLCAHGKSSPQRRTLQKTPAEKSFWGYYFVSLEGIP
jgi:hypothetical protein